MNKHQLTREIKDMSPTDALRELAKIADRAGNRTLVWTYFKKFREIKRKARLSDTQRA